MIRDEGIPPRYHPQFALWRALGAITPQTCNGITRRALLNWFRPQLMGESPVLHASGFHHPALSENANQHKTTQSQLFQYWIYSSIFTENMQVFFLVWDGVLLTEPEIQIRER